MTSNHRVHLSAIEAIAERLVRDRHEKGYAATPEADTLRLVIAELKDLRQEMGAPTLLSASARCPLCGQEGPHPHTPLEQAIYRNGLKAGSLHAETPLERAFAEEPQRTIVNDALLKIGAGDETSGELEQLRRIDQAARAFVNAIPELMTFKGGQRAFEALCDALFDWRPAEETVERRTIFERARDAIMEVVQQTTGEQNIHANRALYAFSLCMQGTPCTDAQEAIRAQLETTRLQGGIFKGEEMKKEKIT